MISLLFIRHGATDWNSQRRIQGQSDIPLNAAGREEVSARKLPAQYLSWKWVCSPLRRAGETALLLGSSDYETDGRLTEMHWGDWEGEQLKVLRKDLGFVMKENEDRGLDFRPPNGESPRMVQDRLRLWLAEVATGGQSVVVVAHKGVIRAALCLATGWDMLGKPPLKLDWGAAHRFVLGKEAGFILAEANIDIGGADPRT